MSRVCLPQWSFSRMARLQEYQSYRLPVPESCPGWDSAITSLCGWGMAFHSRHQFVFRVSCMPSMLRNWSSLTKQDHRARRDLLCGKVSNENNPPTTRLKYFTSSLGNLALQVCCVSEGPEFCRIYQELHPSEWFVRKWESKWQQISNIFKFSSWRLLLRVTGTSEIVSQQYLLLSSFIKYFYFTCDSWVYMSRTAPEEVTGQFCGISSLLPSSHRSRGGTQSKTLHRKRKVRVWNVAQSVRHAVPYKDLSSIARLHNNKKNPRYGRPHL